MVPAGVDFDQYVSDHRSMYVSEAIISNRSCSVKPRVAKISRRPPKQEYINITRCDLLLRAPPCSTRILARGL